MAEAETSLVKRGLPDSIPLVSAAESTNAAEKTGKRAVLRKIQLPGSKDQSRTYINCLEIGPWTRQPDEEVTIIGHGYGNALGFWWQNLAAIAAAKPNARQYYIDWLGSVFI